ncbi:MAG TPA: hypothetical protein VE821_07145 [Pyrinomonadaceae bacterium]|nr:hypothetical protein [Pyrinomonadaceae bacterium]
MKMKILQYVSALSMIALLVVMSAAGQQRRARASVRKVAPPAVSQMELCEGAKMPAGWVVVGVQHSAKCGGRLLMVKKPAARELVCGTSPVPEGYRVISQDATQACLGTDDNPLANAMTIVRDDAPDAETAARAPGAAPQGATAQARSEAVEPNATQWPHNGSGLTTTKLGAKLDDVRLNMTKEEVVSVWGRCDNIEPWFTNHDGNFELWHYRFKGMPVTLLIRDGKVTNIRMNE